MPPFTGGGKSNEKTSESSFILSIDKLLKLLLFLKLFKIFENVVAGVVAGALVAGAVAGVAGAVAGITLHLHKGHVECNSSHVMIRNGTKQCPHSFKRSTTEVGVNASLLIGHSVFVVWVVLIEL